MKTAGAIASNYMRSVMDLSPRFNDQTEDDVVTYLTSTFGPDSTKPKSPADLPGYKDTVRTFSDDAMNIVYVEYDVATSPGLPWSANPDKEGNLWMPYYGDGNKVGRLNPKTGEVTFFSLPPEHSAGIHSVIPVADGTVWFTEFFNNKIAHLDPKHQGNHRVSGRRRARRAASQQAHHSHGPHRQALDERQPLQQLRSQDEEIYAL